MKFLLTGFEPFGGSSINPSEQVTLALDGQTITGASIVTAILPVAQQDGPAALLGALHTHHPDAVLCLGKAGRRPVLSVERVAVNLLDYEIPDNNGLQISDRPVVPGGPDAYFVTLPARAVCDAIRAAGIPAECSLSAGSFLCNQVLYRLLHFLSQENWHIPAGFLHLPSLPEEVARLSQPTPSMSLETSLAGVRAAIACIVQNMMAQ